MPIDASRLHGHTGAAKCLVPQTCDEIFLIPVLSIRGRSSFEGIIEEKPVSTSLVREDARVATTPPDLGLQSMDDLPFFAA
jgi:hypothetical protein